MHSVLRRQPWITLGTLWSISLQRSQPLSSLFQIERESLIITIVFQIRLIFPSLHARLRRAHMTKTKQMVRPELNQRHFLRRAMSAHEELEGRQQGLLCFGKICDCWFAMRKRTSMQHVYFCADRDTLFHVASMLLPIKSGIKQWSLICFSSLVVGIIPPHQCIGD